MTTATIDDVTRALITSLRAAVWVQNPNVAATAPAPWGARVHLRRSSQLIELPPGSVAGDGGPPAEVAYPLLYLVGPEVVRMKEFDSDLSQERLAEDRVAGTMTVRAWPRRVTLRFSVVFLTRDGKTGAAVAADAQANQATVAFAQWVRRTPKLLGAQVIETEPLDDTTERVTAADIVRRQGSVEIRHVMVYDEGPRVVDTATTIHVHTRPFEPS